jgi:hypothetical protein
MLILDDLTRDACFELVMRMEDYRIPKWIMLWKSECRRLKGRLRKGWIDDEENMTIIVNRRKKSFDCL